MSSPTAFAAHAIRGATVLCATALACMLLFASLARAEHGQAQDVPASEARRVLQLVEADAFLAATIDAIPQARRSVSVHRSPGGTNYAVDVYDETEPVLWIYVQGSPLQIVEVRTGGFESAAEVPSRKETDLIGGEVAGGYLAMAILSALLVAGTMLIARTAGTRRALRTFLPLVLVAGATWAIPLAQHLPPGAWLSIFGIATTAAAAALLWAAARRVDADPLRPPIPGTAAAALAVVGCAGLVVRIAVAIVEPFPVDVGSASATGGAAIVSGRYVYGAADFAALPGGSTYGPLMYMLYAVPAWLARGYGLAIDPDAIAITMGIVADLAVATLLVAACHRMRGRVGAAVAVFLWGSLPTAWWATITGMHDAFVGLCLAGAALLAARPGIAGGLVGLAAALKLAPLAGAAALLGGGVRASLRRAGPIALGILAGLAPAAAYVLGHGGRGVELFFESTIGFQWDRAAAMSGWRYLDAEWVRGAATIAVAGLAAVIGVRSSPTVRGATGALAAIMLLVALLSASWLPNLLLWAAPSLIVWTVLSLTPPPDASRPARVHIDAAG